MEGGWGPDILAKHMSGLTFRPQYRLSSHLSSQFPVVLQDAVSSYIYLLELRITAPQIIFSRDSAGGNLALTLRGMLSLMTAYFRIPASFSSRVHT